MLILKTDLDSKYFSKLQHKGQLLQEIKITIF